MKIFLDECVPFKFKNALFGHSVYGVGMMGWNGVKNGDLIKLADEQFDVFITIDKNLIYQQNLSRIRLAILLMNVPNNKLSTIMAMGDRVLQILNNGIKSGEFYQI